MADAFNLIRTPKLVFGPGKSMDLPSLLSQKAKQLLIITGANSHRTNQPVADLLDHLEKSEFNIRIENIPGEPTPANINEITARRQDIDVVVAIGGGSVIDAGKAVSAMIRQHGDVRDYLEGVGIKSPTGEKLFFVAVPTTAGTGSEATSNAVITQTGENGFKKSLRHENFVPDMAVIDPVLSLQCPPDITAASGMDAFTQLLESYVSVKSNSFTDALALDGIMHVNNSLEKAVFSGEDIKARSGMAYAAYLSGITLANAGLGLIHGFASAVGGYYYVPHGTVCGTLMGVVNRWNINELKRRNGSSIAAEKYATVGKLLSGGTEHNQNWYMEYVADYIEQLTAKFGIKRLGEFGVNSQSLEKIVAATDHKANPVKFEKESLIEMLKSRI